MWVILSKYSSDSVVEQMDSVSSVSSWPTLFLRIVMEQHDPIRTGLPLNTTLSLVSDHVRGKRVRRKSNILHRTYFEGFVQSHEIGFIEKKII